MKIAAISDIHGNLPALDAVLADIAAQRVDVVVNLGDILSGPLWAAATADRLMPLGLPTIAGNHERQLLTVAHERMGASDRHAHDELRPEHRAWIRGLPATLALDAGGRHDIGGGGREITGDAMQFALVATGRADAATMGLDADVSIY